MMRLIAGMAIAIVFGVSTAGAGSGVVVTPVVRATSTIVGQPIELPQDDPEVSVSIYEVPPGAAVPRSMDVGMRYDYVLSGHLRIENPETGVVSNFSQGDFVVGRPGQWRSAENSGETTMKLLVIRQAPVDNTGRRWLRSGNGLFLMPAPN